MTFIIAILSVIAALFAALFIGLLAALALAARYAAIEPPRDRKQFPQRPTH